MPITDQPTEPSESSDRLASLTRMIPRQRPEFASATTRQDRDRVLARLADEFLLGDHDIMVSADDHTDDGPKVEQRCDGCQLSFFLPASELVEESEWFTTCDDPATAVVHRLCYDCNVTWMLRVAFLCSESVARGDGCLDCGVGWQQALDDAKVSTLSHDDDCAYLEMIDDLDHLSKHGMFPTRQS